MLRPWKVGGLVVALAAMAACSSAGATDDAPTGAGGGGGSTAGASGATSSEGGAAGDSGSEGGAAGDTGAGTSGAAGTVSLGGSGGQGPIEGCQTSTIPGNRVPASVLIVLDRSGSMEDDGKWGFAVSALKTALKTADPELGMGILRFPEGSSACTFDFNCQCKDIKDIPNVPVAPLKVSAGQISQFLSTTTPEGDTPTLWALRKAYTYMQGLQVEGERYVLLVTDGEPSYYYDFLKNPDCGVEADLAKAPSDARKGTPPVRTFVIGAPGSEGAALVLSGIAQNGGGCRPGGDPKARTCHYAIDSINFEDDLAATLSQIAGTVSSCVYEVPKPNGKDVDPNFVNVAVDTGNGEEVVPQDSKQEKGWNYTDDSKTKIEIFGEQCEAIKASLESKVNIVLGCATVVVPIG